MTVIFKKDDVAAVDWDWESLIPGGQREGQRLLPGSRATARATPGQGRWNGARSARPHRPHHENRIVCGKKNADPGLSTAPHTTAVLTRVSCLYSLRLCTGYFHDLLCTRLCRGHRHDPTMTALTFPTVSSMLFS